MSILNIR